MASVTALGDLSRERTLPPGRIISERYEVLRTLGSGGMGTVYEVRHIELGCCFALKHLRSELAMDPRHAERFQREARAVCLLETRRIPKPVDLGRDDAGVPYIVMELLRGHSLRNELDAVGLLSAGQAARIIVELCLAAGVAHAACLVHRDIKPENVYLAVQEDNSLGIRLLDFGVALAANAANGRTTTAGRLVGTCAYMAPEQANAGREITAQADIYAIGAVLYELLSGSRPIPDGDHRATLHHVLFRPPTPLHLLQSGLPAELYAIVAKAMAFRAEERFSCTEAFVEALLPYADMQVNTGRRSQGAASRPRVRRPDTAAVTTTAGESRSVTGTNLGVAPEVESVLPTSNPLPKSSAGIPRSRAHSREKSSGATRLRLLLRPAIVLGAVAVGWASRDWTASGSIALPLNGKPMHADRGVSSPPSPRPATPSFEGGPASPRDATVRRSSAVRPGARGQAAQLGLTALDAAPHTSAASPKSPPSQRGGRARPERNASPARDPVLASALIPTPPPKRRIAPSLGSGSGSISPTAPPEPSFDWNNPYGAP